MYPATASTVDSEESLLDPSTAPTTPDESLTFSPVLHALKIQDGLEDTVTTPTLPTSQSPFHATRHATSSAVQNICCVGAGYVGKSSAPRPPSWVPRACG
jgi:UDPglucose 6-dehydrogenase